jgi:16S rRNA (uracil1498-N3)-methyltransferase
VTPSEGPDPAVPFAFVDDVEHPALGPADRHHLERVRRLRPGDELVVGDGAGRHRRVRFGPDLEPIGAIVIARPPARPVTVAFALTKGDRPELVVQKLTELGVDRIIPFVGARTVVRWDPAKSDRNLDRLRVVAREAAAQAHRPWLPEVGRIAAAAEVVALPGLALAELGGAPVSAGLAAVAVGPEGGWSDEERAGASATVDLGPTVLRAETAALAAGTLLTALRDGRILDTHGG